MSTGTHEPAVPVARKPILEPAAEPGFHLGGVLGQRVEAVIEGWLLPAPDANPALVDMFRDRDRSPVRGLVPWAGEFIGKYLIGAQQFLRLTGDERLRGLIAELVDELLSHQAEDGYLGPFPKDERLVRHWDVWGHYHAMLALMDYHETTGDERALDACRRISALLDAFFIDGKRRMVTPEDGHGEKNYAVIHALVRLHHITGDDSAARLVEWIMREWDVPPAGRYITSALEGKPVSEFPAHRWESLHDHQGIAAEWFLHGDEKLKRAFQHIWWSCLEGDRHNTGGFTAGEECKGNAYAEGAIETCCTVAWIALSVDMLRMTGDSRVADEIEFSLFNGILGGLNPSGRWWTYDTPMHGVKKASAHDIVFQSRAGSPEFNCCSANAPRGIGMLADWAVMATGKGLAVNYYGESRITARLPGGGSVVIAQKTDYPVGPEVRIATELAEAKEFELALRIPGWSHRTALHVNGTPVQGAKAGGYVAINRTWRDGDTIEIAFDFAPHVWIGDRECAGKMSIYRGPLLLAYDPRFNDMDPDDMPTVRVEDLAFTDCRWKGRHAPWVLVSVPTVDGRELRLSDFANTGVTGTWYETWLPCDGGAPRPFSRERAQWA